MVTRKFFVTQKQLRMLVKEARPGIKKRAKQELKRRKALAALAKRK